MPNPERRRRVILPPRPGGPADQLLEARRLAPRAVEPGEPLPPVLLPPGVPRPIQVNTQW